MFKIVTPIALWGLVFLAGCQTTKGYEICETENCGNVKPVVTEE